MIIMILHNITYITSYFYIFSVFNTNNTDRTHITYSRLHNNIHIRRYVDYLLFTDTTKVKNNLFLFSPLLTDFYIMNSARSLSLSLSYLYGQIWIDPQTIIIIIMNSSFILGIISLQYTHTYIQKLRWQSR